MTNTTQAKPETYICQITVEYSKDQDDCVQTHVDNLIANLEYAVMEYDPAFKLTIVMPRSDK